MDNRGRPVEELMAKEDVQGAGKMLSMVMSQLKTGVKPTDADVASAQEIWRYLRNGKTSSRVTKNEFQELQGRVLLPCVRVENRYSDVMSRELVAIVSTNQGFMYSVVREYHEALVALTTWKVRGVTWHDTKGLVQEYDKRNPAKDVPASEQASDELDVFADASATFAANKGPRFPTLRLFAGLTKREPKAPGGSFGDDPPLGPTREEQIEELQGQLKALDEKIVELMKAGGKMDIGAFGEVQKERAAIEEQITELEKEPVTPVVNPTKEAQDALEAAKKYDEFVGRLTATLLPDEKKEEIDTVAVNDLVKGERLFAQAMAEYEESQKAKPPTKDERIAALKARTAKAVEEKILGKLSANAISTGAETDIDLAEGMLKQRLAAATKKAAKK